MVTLVKIVIKHDNKYLLCSRGCNGTETSYNIYKCGALKYDFKTIKL